MRNGQKNTLKDNSLKGKKRKRKRRGGKEGVSGKVFFFPQFTQLIIPIKE